MEGLLALKIIGILLAAVISIIFIILMLRAKVVFLFSTKGKIELKASLLFFTVYDLNKKKKKTGKFGAFLKRIFGIDTLTNAQEMKTEAAESGISGAVTKVVTVLTLLAGQILWLLKRVDLKNFRVLAICGGGDAADTAMDYGLVCSAIYPFAGYLESTVNTAKNAIDIQAGCDFANEPEFELEIIAKIRIIHIVRAIWRNAVDGIDEEVAHE